MNYKDYHKDWKDIIRPAVLKRDQYKCRHCSVPHKARVYMDSKRKYVVCDDFIEQWAKNQGKKVFTVYLHVAHIDQDKSNNDFVNLISLCPKCHTKFDKEYVKFKKSVKLAKESTSKDYLLTSLSSSNSIVYSEIRKFVYQLTQHKLTTLELEHIILIVKKNTDYEFRK